MKIPVSEFLVRFMERMGIQYIFGMPGAHILPVYDALHGASIKTVLAKHEQGAAFMAGGLARATGGIGACIATAGPGATNLVTGIANAHADRLPVLAITGETSTHIFGRGGLQESSGEGGAVDQVALFQSITHYARLVERTDYLVNVLNQVAQVLRSGKPGPVLLSLPFNVQKETLDASLLDEIYIPESSSPGPLPRSDVKALARRLVEARHPVIVAGYGCIRAGVQPLLEQLANRLGAHVATSLKAKGAIDECSPLALGSLGVTSGGHAYRHIRENADLLLFLGAAFNERTSYTWKPELLEGRTLIQVDLDPTRLGRVFQPHLALAADLGELLPALLEELNLLGIGEVGQQPAGKKEESGWMLAGSEFLTGFGLVERFFRELKARAPGHLMVFDDNIIFAQNFFQVGGKHRYFPNSGISSLGHAIPAAIGARFANEAPTVAVLGDGGFQMCGMELMTAVNYKIPLTVVLFNNGTMGLIRKNQYQQYSQRYIDCDFVNPDYAKLAEAFGIVHHRVEEETDLEPVFQALDLENGINLVEILIDRNAFPDYQTSR